MKRIIIDYQKLTTDILNLLVEKYPDGYNDDDIVRFKNAKNEKIEAVEVRTETTIYLVKVSKHLSATIQNHEDDDKDNDAIDIPISESDNFIDEFDE